MDGKYSVWLCVKHDLLTCCTARCLAARSSHRAFSGWSAHCSLQGPTPDVRPATPATATPWMWMNICVHTVSLVTCFSQWTPAKFFTISTLSNLIAELSLSTMLHVISARCVAPWPFERRLWRQFEVQWGGCKKNSNCTCKCHHHHYYYHYYFHHHHHHHHHDVESSEQVCPWDVRGC